MEGKNTSMKGQIKKGNPFVFSISASLLQLKMREISTLANYMVESISKISYIDFLSRRKIFSVSGRRAQSLSQLDKCNFTKNCW